MQYKNSEKEKVKGIMPVGMVNDEKVGNKKSSNKKKLAQFFKSAKK